MSQSDSEHSDVGFGLSDQDVSTIVPPSSEDSATRAVKFNQPGYQRKVQGAQHTLRQESHLGQMFSPKPANPESFPDSSIFGKDDRPESHFQSPSQGPWQASRSSSPTQPTIFSDRPPHAPSVPESEHRSKMLFQPDMRHELKTKRSHEKVTSVSPGIYSGRKGFPSDAMTMRSGTSQEFMQPGSKRFRKHLIRDHGWGKENQHVGVSLKMPDNFKTFLNEELEKGDSLWDLVVLTGYPKTANKGEQSLETLWATTCGEYIKFVWPQSAEVIHKLIRIIQREDDPQQSMSLMKSADDGVSIRCDLSTQEEGLLELSLDSAGPVLHVIDVLQAISWLFAVLQTGSEDVPYACSVKFRLEDRIQSNQDEAFSLCVDNLSTLVVPQHSSCWTSLFPRTPCTVEFPYKGRLARMVGVELQFELLCFLCGLDYMVEEDEGLLLFGPESLVYPVRQEGNCVQWHFQHCKPDNEEQHQIRGERLRTLDLESLCEPLNRHFLGMWPQSFITLGTDTQADEEITWSSAETVSHEDVPDGFTYGAGISIKGIVSLKWDKTYKIANSRKPVTMRSLDSRLHSSRNEPVMLYSPSEKRAWMVPFMSVFWHLVRAQANTRKRLGYAIPPCTRNGNGGETAFECFMACRTDPARRPIGNQILTEAEKAETIQDFAEDVWKAMLVATRQSCLRRRLFRDKMIGFELADIAIGSPYLTLRAHGLDFTVGGSWLPLLDRVRLTFFYEGMSDPILPGDQMSFNSACSASIWRNTPKGFNLLTASLPCLAFLGRDQNAGKRTLTRLAPDSYWSSDRPAGQLFHTCERNDPHICSRLQELTREKWANDPKILKSEAEKDGAVVFRFKYGIGEIINRQESRLIVKLLSSENSISDTPSSSSVQGYKTHTQSLSGRKHKDSSDSGYSSSTKPLASPTHDSIDSRAVISEGEEDNNNDNDNDSHDKDKSKMTSEESKKTNETASTKRRSFTATKSESRDDSKRYWERQRRSSSSQADKTRRDGRDRRSSFKFPALLNTKE